MQPAFVSQEQEIKKLWHEFLKAVKAGDDKSDLYLEMISELPTSQAALLAGPIIDLCSTRPNRNDPEAAYRCQLIGSQIAQRCGLSFDREIINQRLVPALMAPILESVVDSTGWKLRLARNLALSQISPKIDESLIDTVLLSMVSHARMQDQLLPGLLAPLATFEESFRTRSFGEDSDIRATAKSYSLQAIFRLMEISVQALAEAEPETFSEALRILSCANIATTYWLTILPSVARSEEDSDLRAMDQILDSVEWLLRRPFGFPGHYFAAEERDRFEGVRSLLSLATGVLVTVNENYLEVVKEMNLPRHEGPVGLGTAFLNNVINYGVEHARERFSGIAAIHFKELRSPNTLHGQESIEIASLAWYLGAVKQGEFLEALEHTRNPRAQVFLAKALRDSDPFDLA